MLFLQAEILNGQLEERINKLEDVHEQKIEQVQFLLGKAEAYKDPDFRSEAVRLIGESAVVKLKLSVGYQLWEEDKKFMLSVMEDKKG